MGDEEIGIFRSGTGLWAVRGVTRAYFGGSSDEPIIGIPAVGSTAGGSLWLQSGSNIYYNTGNVGIGTDAPTVELEVSGIIAATGGNSDSWNSGFAERWQWDGGASNLIPITGRESLELGGLATLDTVNNGDWSPTPTRIMYSSRITGFSPCRN